MTPNEHSCLQNPFYALLDTDGSPAQGGRWGLGSGDFSNEAKWPRLDPSLQASKGGCFPRPLCVSKCEDWEERSQLCCCCGIVWPLCLSLALERLGAGARGAREEGAKMPPSGQGWGLPTGATCSEFLSVFRKKARKSQTGFPGLENPHLPVASPI